MYLDSVSRRAFVGLCGCGELNTALLTAEDAAWRLWLGVDKGPVIV